MKKHVLAVALGAAVAALSMWPATAAPPKPEKADATLSPTSKKHEWTGGPYTEVWPGNFVRDDLGPGSQCGLPESAGPSPITVCDYTFLEVQPGPGGGLTVEFELTHAPNDDFDFYVYDPEGKELVSAGAATPVDPTERARLRFSKPGIYTVEVVHFAVLAGSYSMSARVP